jgi:hypothetical protein
MFTKYKTLEPFRPHSLTLYCRSHVPLKENNEPLRRTDSKALEKANKGPSKNEHMRRKKKLSSRGEAKVEKVSSSPV